MKKGIHPQPHAIKVVMTDGTEISMRSMWGKEGDVMQLDIDSKTHPAWTGKHRVIDTGGKIASFEKKFGHVFTLKKDSA